MTLSRLENSQNRKDCGLTTGHRIAHRRGGDPVGLEPIADGLVGPPARRALVEQPGGPRLSAHRLDADCGGDQRPRFQWTVDWRDPGSGLSTANELGKERQRPARIGPLPAG